MFCRSANWMLDAAPEADAAAGVAAEVVAAADAVVGVAEAVVAADVDDLGVAVEEAWLEALKNRSMIDLN